MRMFTEVGRRVLPHCTAVGKALLATSPDTDVRALLSRTGLPRHTPHTVTDPDELLAQLVRVRDRGYAMDEGEQEVGVRCVAVAVPGSTIRLAMSVSGPAPRMSDELLVHAVPVLKEAARSLGAELSYRPVPRSRGQRASRRVATSARNAAQSGSTESSKTARAEWLSGAVSGSSAGQALIET